MQPEALIAAVEQAADGIVVTDTAAIIRYVNPAFTLLTGCTSEESVGRNTNMLRAGAAGPSLRN
jgi:NNP family nitrate/nitrite transporter-like MFS transporter